MTSHAVEYLRDTPPDMIARAGVQPAGSASAAAKTIAGAALPVETNRDLDPVLSRVGSARVVLIGEASHGTHEFYRLRAEITMRLIREKGFSAIAVEADWPDAARIDRYVRHLAPAESAREAFERFPTWMWRNEE
ncbi:MAG TPA: erythromycin esterase family protein, partial [Gemmatimonadaceae bacterium]|nr:erythromycin esterase family protein [Gemmatimonadaceae bacterium]